MRSGALRIFTSLIGVLAVAHAVYGIFVEQQTVIAAPEPEQPCELSGERLDVAVARFGVAVTGFPNMKSDRWRYGANVGRRAGPKYNSLHGR